MKAENLNQKCPVCGCTDKNISRKRDAGHNDEAFYIPHVPQGTVGVIKCSECGHCFEYCTDEQCLVEIHKLVLGGEKDKKEEKEEPKTP